MAASKKRRFEIFKRDNFTCQYCGRKTPDIVLEVDHIIPVVDGGKDKAENLISACFDCNRGKGKHGLEKAFFEKFDVQKEIERQKQYKQYLRLESQNNQFIESQIDDLISYMVDTVKEYGKSDGFKTHCSQDQVRRSLKAFLKHFSVDDLKTTIDKACARCEDNHFRYFCGICWKEIKGKQALNG